MPVSAESFGKLKLDMPPAATSRRVPNVICSLIFSGFRFFMLFCLYCRK